MYTNRVVVVHVQMFGMPYQATYHQTQGLIPYSNGQPVYGSTGNPGPPMYTPCIGTPIAPSTTYNNQVTYGAQQHASQYEGPNPHHLPLHNLPPGPGYNSQPGQHGRILFTAPQQFRGPGHENPQPRPATHYTQSQVVEGQPLRRVPPPSAQFAGGDQAHLTTFPETMPRRGASYVHKEIEFATPAPSSLGRQASNPTSSAYTTSGIGTLPDHHSSTMEQSPMAHTSNSPQVLSTNSNKASPPYTSSQRKQLRVEEKCYLKEVKRSIAEGRVPRVHLAQNVNGDIVQYKAQFLNALKLAALAIEPNADIDVHNPATMQEIMKEVKRQFIIEKPLPDGMVAGFLQRLYKRNRVVYHRHWTIHGDDRKPDDCSLAAWLQLVDYKKSTEGNKECERNKTNALSKKKL